MTDLVLRRAEELDLPAMLAVLQESFRRWPRYPAAPGALEHLRWKVSGHPDSGQVQVVAEVNGTLAGVSLRTVLPLRFLGGEKRATYGADSAVSPAFQGRGVYREMLGRRVAEFDSGFDLHINATANPLAQRTRTKIGDRPFGNPPELLVRPALRGLPRSVLQARSALRRAWARAAARRPRRVAVTQLERFDERLDRLWEAAAPSGDAFGRAAELAVRRSARR
jgi:hypothetical protein